jgi:hypothetical protein
MTKKRGRPPKNTQAALLNEEIVTRKSKRIKTKLFLIFVKTNNGYSY